MNYVTFGFVATYLTGRLLFYDMQIILSGRRAERKAVLKRTLWGLWLILFATCPVQFLALFLLHFILVLVDSKLKSNKPALNRWFYALHGLILLLVWAYLLPLFDRLWANLENPFNLLNFCSANTLVTYLLIFIGFLFTQKEATIVIRLILQRWRAVPKRDNRKKDQREYELGRVIGLLERTFLYFLIIWNQVGAIAILIALKSLARFKDLEDRTFAEYFLVGSLLSILTAAIPAVLVILVR